MALVHLEIPFLVCLPQYELEKKLCRKKMPSERSAFVTIARDLLHLISPNPSLYSSNSVNHWKFGGR